MAFAHAIQNSRDSLRQKEIPPRDSRQYLCSSSPRIDVTASNVSKRVYRGDWAAAVVRYFLHKAEKTCQQRMAHLNAIGFCGVRAYADFFSFATQPLRPSFLRTKAFTLPPGGIFATESERPEAYLAGFLASRSGATLRSAWPIVFF